MVNPLPLKQPFYISGNEKVLCRWHRLHSSPMVELGGTPTRVVEFREEKSEKSEHNCCEQSLVFSSMLIGLDLFSDSDP